MTGGLETSTVERGLVRVFALSMSQDEAQALRDNTPEDGAPAPQAAALGLDTINADYIEVFPVSDLSEIGLTGYLVEGNGIDPDSLRGDRAKLDALDGWVMCVYSAAFGGRAVTLRPAPELTLIGTYAEPGVDWSDQQKLQSDAARGTTAAPKKAPSDAAMSGRIAMGALLVLVLLTALMIWVAAR